MNYGQNLALTSARTGAYHGVEEIPQMPPANSNELGEFIHKSRMDKGLGLRPLARASGVDWSYIGKLEKGEIAGPDPIKLQKLAQALGVEVEDFYALAGYLVPEGLPQLAPYLRAKYDLPEPAADDVERYLARLRRRYDKEPSQQTKRSRRKP